MNNVVNFADPKAKQVLVDEARANILNIATEIIRNDGWEALSMRKIAVQLKYSAPAIYKYFKSKDDIRAELIRLGFLRVAEAMNEARKKNSEPIVQLEQMWLAYILFAQQDKMLYRIMLGMETLSPQGIKETPEAIRIKQYVTDVISNLSPQKNKDAEPVTVKFFTIWAFAHGLVSINLNCAELSKESLQNILTTQIRIVIQN